MSARWSRDTLTAIMSRSMTLRDEYALARFAERGFVDIDMVSYIDHSNRDRLDGLGHEPRVIEYFQKEAI